MLCYKVTTWLQAAALLAAEDINTASHVIIQGLCSNAGGAHFAVRVQVGPRLQDLVEGEEVEDKYYLCDGLKSDGELVSMSQKKWLRLTRRWLVHFCGAVLWLCLALLKGFVSDAIRLPDDEAASERLKSIVMNCVGNLRCKWTELKCKNKLPGADATVRIMSCPYDSEVCVGQVGRRLNLLSTGCDYCAVCVVAAAQQHEVP
jgi:hypothetical protein